MKHNSIESFFIKNHFYTSFKKKNTFLKPHMNIKFINTKWKQIYKRNNKIGLKKHILCFPNHCEKGHNVFEYFYQIE